jgi:hypothetical protein
VEFGYILFPYKSLWRKIMRKVIRPKNLPKNLIPKDGEYCVISDKGVVQFVPKLANDIEYLMDTVDEIQDLSESLVKSNNDIILALDSFSRSLLDSSKSNNNLINFKLDTIIKILENKYMISGSEKNTDTFGKSNMPI